MSNGSARNRVVLVVSGRLGLPGRARGERHRAGLDPGLAPALGIVPADPAGRQRARRGPARRPDGQQRSGPPQPGRRPGGAAGPGAHLPEHPERRVLPAPPPGGALRQLRQTGGTLHLVGLLGPGGVHALDRHLLACVELGVRHRVPAIAIHGFLDGRDSAPDPRRRGGPDPAPRHAADRRARGWTSPR